MDEETSSRGGPVNSNSELTNFQPVKLRRGRPARRTVEPAKWTIRGVEPETRLIIEQGASHSGKTLGQFFNVELQEAAKALIGSSDALPVRFEDQLILLFAQLKADLQTQQAAELSAIRLAIDARPITFFDWFFGKKGRS